MTDQHNSIPPRWPKGAQAAISMTIDNMGEAADLNRKLWPEGEPIGHHFSVTQVLPEMLRLLKKYNISATYFIESWNINVYGETILRDIAAAGHEVGWHAWQHEAWSKLTDAEEKDNFERSFGPQGVGAWVTEKKIEPYRGFRPPGGIIKEHTTELAREFGLEYISPAAEQAAVVKVAQQDDSIVILPFKWVGVDAYYYMKTFAGLRHIRGEYEDPSVAQSPDEVVRRYTAEIDAAIEKGGFLALLFHPFLTDRPERLRAVEEVLAYLAKQRDEGKIWLAPCKEIAAHIRQNSDCVGDDPLWDLTTWSRDWKA
ncbi:hypothetical protein BX600DRAFT_469009 [Xylariales sp. PMI_506]|nr:hypothetical protein BX600DRAFT_469009 [Xylariales sp. PMI_506]